MNDTEETVSTSQKTILAMTKELQQRQALLAWVKRHAATLDSLPFAPYFFDGNCDFDGLSHEHVLLVLKALPAGQWTKTPMGERVTYEGIYDGITVRCWAGEAPPSCQIIEEKVLVPERWETVRKLVCPKGEVL